MSVLDVAIEMVAHLEGVSEAQLAQIEAALPATSKLIALSVKAKPLLVKLGPLMDELVPLYTEAKPMITEAISEWQQVGPALAVILSVLSKRTAAGSTLSEAAAGLADEYPPQAQI
jgi:hypothetical protein